jgi:hypothetical protein
MNRWWLLFRGLAFPTILFLAPVVVVQELGRLSYLLSVRGAVAELALEISAVLLLDALCAIFLALILFFGHEFKLWDNEPMPIVQAPSHSQALSYATSRSCFLSSG